MLATISCSESEVLPAHEYAEEVGKEESDLRKEKVVGDFVFDLLYKPLDYVVLMESSGASFTERKKIKNEYASMQYFTFRIKCKSWKDDLLKYGISDNVDYTQRLAYCMSALQDNLTLEEDGRVLPCRLFHFERIHQLDAGLTFLVGFDRNPKEKEAELNDHNYTYSDKTFSYDDQLFGNGQINITLSGNTITKHPRLKTETR